MLEILPYTKSLSVVRSKSTSFCISKQQWNIKKGNIIQDIHSQHTYLVVGSFILRPLCEDQLKKLHCDIIHQEKVKESPSPWSFQVLLATKTDGWQPKAVPGLFPAECSDNKGCFPLPLASCRFVLCHPDQRSLGTACTLDWILGYFWLQDSVSPRAVTSECWYTFLLTLCSPLKSGARLGSYRNECLLMWVFRPWCMSLTRKLNNLWIVKDMLVIIVPLSS